MNIHTKSVDCARAYATNSTSASLTNPVPTTTEPTGDGVVDLRMTASSESPNFAEVLFFGAGANNATGAARIFLWNRVGTLWIPTPILNVDLVLSAVIGVAGASVIDTDRFADAVTLTASSTNTDSYSLFSPANDSIGYVRFDCVGAPKLEIRFAKSTATNLNALVRKF